MFPSSHYKKQWICVRIWVLSGHSARVSKRIITTAEAQDVSMTALWFGSKITFEGTKIIKETLMKFDFVDAHAEWTTTACCISFFNLGECPTITPRNMHLKKTSKDTSPFEGSS